MRRLPRSATTASSCHRQHSALRFLSAGVLLVASAIATYGDVPARLRSIPAANCYCHCHQAYSHAGCTKMCDAKKHARKWLITSCLKPRYQSHAPDKSNAGPHLRHPDRAQHAQLTQ